jgi:hypothetical protein
MGCVCEKPCEGCTAAELPTERSIRMDQLTKASIEAVEKLLKEHAGDEKEIIFLRFRIVEGLLRNNMEQISIWTR